MNDPLQKRLVWSAFMLIIALELGLSADCFYLRWQQYVPPFNQPPEVFGEGFVIR